MSATAILVAVIGSGGLVGAMVAFLKLRPEKDSIVVTAAQGALIVQSGVLDDVREALEECKKRTADMELRGGEEVADLRREVREMKALHDRQLAELREKLEQVTAERDRLLAERNGLTGRIRHLEQQVAELERKASG